jgi:hypothetical protein
MVGRESPLLAPSHLPGRHYLKVKRQTRLARWIGVRGFDPDRRESESVTSSFLERTNVMATFNIASVGARKDQVEKLPQVEKNASLAYSAPEMFAVGKAVDLVQGPRNYSQIRDAKWYVWHY